MTITNLDMTVAGVTVGLCTAGSGTPLLFLHSGPGPTYDSEQFVESLAADYRVVAPYHPGFGRHERPHDFETTDDLVYFYLDFLKENDLFGVPVVAASFGGWIAAEIAIRDPSAFSRMVLINPLGLRVGGPMDRPIADIWAISRQARRELQFHNETLRVDDLAARSDEQLLELARFEENLARYAWKPFLHNPHLRKWLRRVECPSLIIRGEEDRFVAPDIHTAFAEMIPGAQVKLVPDAGHHPHAERPEFVAAAVVEFLGRSYAAETRRN